jgi:hypothetical protein
MNDVMVDLETLGTRAGRVVLSIGAVEFDTKSNLLGREFYVVINQQSSLDSGLTKDPNTVNWWEQQNEEAKKVLSISETGGESVEKALEMFNEFLTPCGADVKLWGNGASFDQPILGGVYDSINKELSWKYLNNRCYRTLKNLFPAVTFKREGTYHNALDDAKSQANHVLEIFKHNVCIA